MHTYSSYLFWLTFHQPRLGTSFSLLVLPFLGFTIGLLISILLPFIDSAYHIIWFSIPTFIDCSYWFIHLDKFLFQKPVWIPQNSPIVFKQPKWWNQSKCPKPVRISLELTKVATPKFHVYNFVVSLLIVSFVTTIAGLEYFLAPSPFQVFPWL